jgi:hypothetical protein
MTAVHDSCRTLVMRDPTPPGLLAGMGTAADPADPADPAAASDPAAAAVAPSVAAAAPSVATATAGEVCGAGESLPWCTDFCFFAFLAESWSSLPCTVSCNASMMASRLPGGRRERGSAAARGGVEQDSGGRCCVKDCRSPPACPVSLSSPLSPLPRATSAHLPP